MKRLLYTLPLLAAIAVASFSSAHRADQPGLSSRSADASQGLPVLMLPEGHPPVEQWLPALPEGHPPVPGYAGECPGLSGDAGGNTDESTVDAQELIST